MHDPERFDCFEERNPRIWGVIFGGMLSLYAVLVVGFLAWAVTRLSEWI